jgi:cytochrome c peroxidase
MNQTQSQIRSQTHRQFASLGALLTAAFSLAACGGSTQEASGSVVQRTERAATPAQHEVPVAIADASGTVQSASTAGFIDTGNLFFTPMGNGRSCSTCHQEAQAWSVTPASLSARFTVSKGTDPVFLTVDGSNSPNAPVATLAQKQSAYSMLLSKAVIRVGLPIPAGAQFQLSEVNDSYGFASAGQLSLFRRPLPTANLKFGNTVMWDGRETLVGTTSPACSSDVPPASCFATDGADLQAQANNAVQTHAQMLAGLSVAQQQSITGFETGLFVAQASDNAAGSLSANGATAGAQNLAGGTFYFGINDFFAGDYQTHARFDNDVMNLFTAWNSLAAPPPLPQRGVAPPAPPSAAVAARASIARGEQLFNTRPFPIANVAGLNDVLNQPVIRGTCSTCHDTPNAGSQSVPRLFNTGVAGANLRTADMPLYTLRNLVSGATVQTTDPGRALVTGKWADVGKFKVPGLRGLAARPPYFHNGSQANLAGVVNFYDKRFGANFTPQEVADLTNFLQSL